MTTVPETDAELVHIVPEMQVTGRPLSPWVYNNEELYHLEQETVFARSWQFAAHANDIPGTGDYLTLAVGDCGVIVIRDTDLVLRAFKNVCRHRASRLLHGSGRCERSIVCPYHGWSYHLDGSLRAIRSPENFPGADTDALGLLEIQLEVFHGLIFVKLEKSGASVVDSFSGTASWFAHHQVADYVQIAEPSVEIWPVNWKVAFDNYLENYHIPLGHPGLQRMLQQESESAELSSGVALGVFAMRDKLSSVAEESRYQKLLHHSNHRLPKVAHEKWVQFSMAPNLGIDLYPEMLDMFQLIPLDTGHTQVRAYFYGHQNPSADELELRKLNLSINAKVNQEDRLLCAGVQAGLATKGYHPGPLSLQESSIHHFHDSIRKLLPVAALPEPPVTGSLRSVNDRLK